MKKIIPVAVLQIVFILLAMFFGMIGQIPLASILFLIALVPFVKLMFKGYSK